MSQENWTLSDYLVKRLIVRQTLLSNILIFIVCLPFKTWGLFGILALFYFYSHI